MNKPPELDEPHSPDPAPPATHCALCGLRLPLRPPAAELQGKIHLFCCAGCRHVFLLLAESGLVQGDFHDSDLYKQCLRLGIIGNPDGADETPALTPEQLKDARELVLHVEGMWCSACSWLIEKVVSSDDGVLEARVNFASDTARICYLPQRTDPASIARSVDRLGYKAVTRDQLAESGSAERNQLLIKTGIAFFLLMNIMFFSYVIYIGYFQQLTSDMQRGVPWILLGLSTPAVAWCGLPIHRKAWQSLRAGAPTMELLLSLSIFSAFGYSLLAMARGSDHFYFDTAAALVTLLLLGKLIEQTAKQKASEQIHRLYQMVPRKVRLLNDGEQRLVAIDQLEVGDHFLVREGEKVPTDGTVVEGGTTVDESLVTGESKPVRKRAGDPVTGSSMNLSGVIEVRADRVGRDTLLSGIIRMVEGALNRKSRLERTVDRVARYFVPAVILLSLATGIVLLATGAGGEAALLRAITVLVIACPCALGMATPLAVAAGVGYAAGRGILIRDGSVIQAAARVDTVVFDKTGTLTSGRFTLLGASVGDDSPETLGLLASLEQYANHPIGEAVVAAARDRGLELAEARQVRIHDGEGIEGLVGPGEGRRVLLGSETFLRRRGYWVSPDLEELALRETGEGKTAVFFWHEDRDAAGCLLLGDALKPTATAAVAGLQEQGVGVQLLSGDGRRTTEAVAALAGISEVRAGVLPAGKIDHIEQLQEEGRMVAMVGDGVNDAPALARAQVGIAVGTGTEIAVESSAFTLLRDDLTLVREALHTSRRTVNTIRQNLVWAFLYNTIGMVLAMAGILNPLIAAAAMLVSSLSVVGNSLRLREGRGGLGKKLVEFFLPWIEPSPDA